jgi:hypothetical protein
VLCENVGGSYYASSARDEVKSKGGTGCVFVDDRTRAVASAYGSFPTTVIDSKEAAEIFSYLNSTKDPVATILPTATVEKFTPAPAVAYFSSRGPSSLTRSILKPDITAPGVSILAAWTGNDSSISLEGKPASQYNVISGTSMAAPHVSAVASLIKSQHPTWGPSAIRSAIMTTATQTNNDKGLITTETGATATPYDSGAGELSSTASMQPGLVYETTETDYLNFLCYYGYNVTTIKAMSKAFPENFTCPADSNLDLISTINYPSIGISGFKGNGSKTVTRTVTNVGEDGEAVYTVSVETPPGFNIQVTPEKLQFTKDGEKLTYQVIVSATASLKQDVFGALTWSNAKYKVRSPIVISSESSRTN